MKTYLIRQEHGLNLLRQAALSQGQNMQLDIIAFLIPGGPFTMQSLGELIRDRASKLTQYAIENDDTILFELPIYSMDHVLWTGLAQYKIVINNKLRADKPDPNPTIHIIPIACLPWS